MIVEISGVKWEMQEAGWWTGELGGVVHEQDGWYFYPANEPVRELIDELAARAGVSEVNGEAWPRYRTVDERPADAALLAHLRKPETRGGLQLAARLLENLAEADVAAGFATSAERTKAYAVAVRGLLLEEP